MQRSWCDKGGGNGVSDGGELKCLMHAGMTLISVTARTVYSNTGRNKINENVSINRICCANYEKFNATDSDSMLATSLQYLYDQLTAAVANLFMAGLKYNKLRCNQ